MNTITTRPAFNVLNDASKVTGEIWQANIPAFQPEHIDSGASVFRDDQRVVESIQILAELIFYNKNNIDSHGKAGSEWIQKRFQSRSPDDFLQSLHPVLIGNFSELLVHGPWIDFRIQEDERIKNGTKKIKFDRNKNTLYMPGYGDTPDPQNIDNFLTAIGIEANCQPLNCEYLLKIYHRLYVKQERLVAIAHLLMSGAQSDLKISKKSLDSELLLQEQLKEYRASYLVEYSTAILAFAKRNNGLHLLSKLDIFSGFKEKHELITSLIAERLSVGSDQFPQIVKSTKKVQNTLTIIGQALVGGFLATEIFRTILEWAFTYSHLDQHSFLINISKIISPSSSTALNEVAARFHSFELIGIYSSAAAVASVVGAVLYFKFTNKAYVPSESHHGSHH